MLVFCSTVADGSESRVPPSCSSELCYSSLQKSDAPSSDRKIVAPLDSPMLRSDFINSGVKLYIMDSTDRYVVGLVFWTTVEVYWSAALQAIIASPCALNGLSPRITGFNERLRTNQCISLTKIRLCYSTSVIQMLSVNLFNTNSTYLRHILNYF